MAGYLKRPPTGLKYRMVKVQTTLVASPGLDLFSRLLARNGAVFGIGGFESPQPFRRISAQHPLGTFLNKSSPRNQP